MNAFKEKVAYFRQKQVEIIEANRRAREVQEECQKELDTKRQELEAKMAPYEQELQKLKETYKAELKSWAGITDGETIDVLTTLDAIHNLVAPHA